MDIVNTVCNADDAVGHENHKHQCKCGTTWKHSNLCNRGTAEEFDLAHECPTCGETQTKKHVANKEDECALIDAFFRRIFGE